MKSTVNTDASAWFCILSIVGAIFLLGLLVGASMAPGFSTLALTLLLVVIAFVVGKRLKGVDENEQR